MDIVWSLYNKVEKMRIDGLKTEHVRIILLSVPTRRMDHWYVCREGDMQWRQVSEIVEFYEDVRLLKGIEENPAKPVSEETRSEKKTEVRRPLFEDAPAEEIADVHMATMRVKERRSTRRFARQLDFQVKIEKDVFKCETHDISTQGLSLKEPLPRWVPKKFHAKLSHAGVTVQVTCQRVADNKLQMIDSESWDVIRQWIVQW